MDYVVDEVDDPAKVVIELRKLAEQMRSNALRAPNPTRLKSLNQACGQEAAALLGPILGCTPEWPFVLGVALRECCILPDDIDDPASMIIDNADDDQGRPMEPFRIFERQMPVDEVDRHYVLQAGRWAKLIDATATSIELRLAGIAAVAELTKPIPSVEPEEAYRERLAFEWAKQTKNWAAVKLIFKKLFDIEISETSLRRMAKRHDSSLPEIDRGRGRKEAKQIANEIIKDYQEKTSNGHA